MRSGATTPASRNRRGRVLALVAPFLFAAVTSGARAQMYVHVDDNGVVTFTDQRTRSDQVRYAPGDFERWAMQQSGVPHVGMLIERQRRAAPRPAPSARSGAVAVSGSAPAPAPKGERFDALLRSAAKKHGVPFPLLKAVVATESAFDPAAVSRAGAQGLMQLMPATAAELGVKDPFDPAQNVDGGAKYLAALLRGFKDETLALAAYNAGPTRVRRLGRVPDFPETRAYVRSVRSLAKRYAKER